MAPWPYRDPLAPIETRGTLLGVAKLDTCRFAGDGLYVIGEQGASVTVLYELVTEGLDAGCIAVWHLEPRRLLTHWPNARAARAFILGKVLQPICA